MNLANAFWAELQHESIATRQTLAAVPFDRLDFKPHEKSMSLLALATHVAEITGWWKECLLQDELDFAVQMPARKPLESTEELLAMFDDLLEKARVILAEVDAAEFGKMWTMRNGETVYFTLPKAAVVRTWCLNHLYHHRAQLGVYLRLLGVAVPGTYGPTADAPGI